MSAAEGAPEQQGGLIGHAGGERGTAMSGNESDLTLEPNLVAPDDFYQDLIDAHRDLSESQSSLLNAKLILLLANHIGDARVLRAAIAAAREDICATTSSCVGADN
jgi:hypothetical protein